ncbi:neutral/alkaline non-lysosomal ceramidase N-terminal domain-containing protein [Singulisphaera sp. PoT]|uniref:neutral/alkaline non-lysosomal ceramidase N-terminal domain-containing protein n=1 Tax=Singulisphaera sp. PoT TaxID=3411797 RepID=UPI003BF582FE
MWAWVGACFGAVLACAEARADLPPVPVGVAEVDITPDYPTRMSGYESRKVEAQGVESRLKAKALAIGGDRARVVLVTVDNCAVPAKIVDEVAGRLKSKIGLGREDFAVCSTHTHSAPMLVGGIPFILGEPLPADQAGRLERYTKEVTDAIEKVALAAVQDRKPSHLDWGQGHAKFAVNRRLLKDGKWVNFGVMPDGAVDRSVPVLRVTSPEGALRAVLVGYACHCTTLEGNFTKVSGDWAGYACEEIERAHPGAKALVVVGCGADSNPQPRGKVEHARQHGAELAGEVEKVLKGSLAPVPATIQARFSRVDVPLGAPRTREALVEMAKGTGAPGYFARTHLERLDRGEDPAPPLKFPVQTWTFGDSLAMVFLGGEVVADYALRLKRECKPGGLWVNAYSNDVTSYIASKRMLDEGGYEVDHSMIYYDRHARLAPNAEDAIIKAVRDILPPAFLTPAP